LNSAQAAASIGLLPIGRDWRSCVDDGSKGVALGVIRALRFWLIVSSTAVRETRRKSRVLAHERELLGWYVGSGESYLAKQSG
jgi:hypothetical protein